MDDVLIGRGVSDRPLGGAGNDTINAVDPGSPEGDVVDYGSGLDRALADRDTEDIISSNCKRVTVG